MSASNDDVRIRIAGDIADIRKSMDQLKRETRAAGREAERSRGRWRQLGRGLDGVRNQVRGLVGAYLGFRGASAALRGVIRNTIEQERVTAQLEARLKSTGGAAGFTRDQLLDMARGLQQVTTFGDEAITAMQTVLLTFTQIRGEVFEEATTAILDMSIALGKDLQSSAQQVGKALNDPIQGISQLRESGVQLNAQQQALVRQFVETGDVASAQKIILQELSVEFGNSAKAARDTLGGSLQSLQNAFGDLLEGSGGNVNDATEAVNELTDLMQDPATVAAFNTLTSSVASLTSWLVKATSASINLRKQQAGMIREIGQGLGIAVAEALGTADANDAVASVNANIAETEKAIADLQRRASSSRFGFGIDAYQIAQEIDALQKRLERFKETRDLLLRNAGSRGFGETAGRLPQEQPTTQTEPVLVDGRPALQRLASQLGAAGVLLSDQLKRLGADLDREFADNLVRFSEYYARRAELETQAIDQQLDAQRNSLAILDEEIRLTQKRGEATEEAENKRAKLVAEITVLERQRADVAEKATRDQAAAERELAEQLDTVRTRLLEMQGQTVEARTAELEREFSDLLARLAAEGNDEGAALVRRLIDVELARTRLQELEDEYQRTLANMSREEQRVQALVDTGTISEREGRRRIIALHQETGAEVERLIPLMRELAEATGDPAAIERLKDLELELQLLRNTVDTTMREMGEVIRDSGENAFASFISGAQNAKDAWGDLVDNIKRRAAELVAEGVFDQIAGLFRGASGGGGVIGQIAGFLAGVFHEGGIAGSATRMRRVPQLAFAGAPRYHSGGLVSGEVPAILKRGEEVLSQRDPRHRNNMSGGGPLTVNIQTRDAESFRRESPGQIAAKLSNELSRARNRNS